MGLGNRNARQHETVGFQKNAMVSANYADFAVDQRVMTIDGFPGVVAAIEDGPFPGTEGYQVVLDNNQGGGLYTTSQLSPMDAVTASTDHTAAEDYPELGDILSRRPDIAQG